MASRWYPEFILPLLQAVREGQETVHECFSADGRFLKVLQMVYSNLMVVEHNDHLSDVVLDVEYSKEIKVI